jgi:hypothetical protein
MIHQLGTLTGVSYSSFRQACKIAASTFRSRVYRARKAESPVAKADPAWPATSCVFLSVLDTEMA